jgi:hypothetical protein
MWVLNLQAQKLMDSVIILVAKTQPFFLMLLHVLWKNAEQDRTWIINTLYQEKTKLNKEK